jgi:hypothetical protein
MGKYVMTLTIAAGAIIFATQAAASSLTNPGTITATDAMSEQYTNELFLVLDPFVTRGSIDIQRSAALMPVKDGGCLPERALSRRGEFWFAFNNRGAVGGKKDLLALSVLKIWLGNPANTGKNVSIGAYRNFNPGYRGGLPSRFIPNSRQPIGGVTVESWNQAHASGDFRQYDHLFGRKRSDQFHASPTPDAPSSATNSGWWIIGPDQLRGARNVAVDELLLRFDRASFDQPQASGVLFSVSGGNYDTLLLRLRFEDQSQHESFRLDAHCASDRP